MEKRTTFRLDYLPANHRYVPMFGDAMTDIGGQRFFASYDEAREAARPLGLGVDKFGRFFVLGESDRA